jgi:5'-deoxynucleotidase YfbR-like HD superfamily hydrolase
MTDSYNPLRVVSAIVGMSAVKRFHGRRTHQTQTISDHSGRVGMTAFFLALEFYKGDYTKANYVAVAGLFHDFPESLLECDIPTHVKNMGDIGNELKDAETSFVKKLFFGDEYIQNLVLENLSKEDFNLMKLADYLDFGFYVREEVDLGNKKFEEFLLWFQNGLSKFPDKILDLPTAKAGIEFVLGPPVKVI